MMAATISVPPDEPLFTKVSASPNPVIMPAMITEGKMSNLGNGVPNALIYSSGNGIHNQIVSMITPKIERRLNCQPKILIDIASKIPLMRKNVNDTGIPPPCDAIPSISKNPCIDSGRSPRVPYIITVARPVTAPPTTS